VEYVGIWPKGVLGFIGHVTSGVCIGIFSSYLILIRYNPHSCLIKLNIGAAIFKNNLCFGLGMCISDEHGRFIKARAQWNYIDPTPTKAELWALLQGLLWIHELGVQNITIEID